MGGNRSLSSYALHFFSGTFLSRVSGMARDVAMAYAFGDLPAVAAFMVAFRLSHLLRRFFGEGPLQSVFIPHYEELRVQDPQAAGHFFRKLCVMLALLLCFLVIGAEGVFAWVLHQGWLAPDMAYIIELTAWMLPSLLFICLYGLNLSLLQCYEEFFLSSFAPFICNTLWTIGIFVVADQAPHQAMFGLTLFTVAGFIAQWLITLPATLRSLAGEWKEWFSLQLFTLQPAFKSLLKAFSLGIIGVSGVQLNVFLDSLLAYYADPRGPAYLWYSIRLEQFAFAVFGMACVGTVIPLLSRHIKSQTTAKAQSLIIFTYRRLLSLMIPCTFCLFTLGCAAVNLIYGHGHFSSEAVSHTTWCLGAYGLGLLPSTAILLFSGILYAGGDFRTSTKWSLFSVAISVTLNVLFIFVFHLGAISIALATSACAWINALQLQRAVKQQGWSISLEWRTIFQLLTLCIAASLGTIALEAYLWNTSTYALLTETSPSYSQALPDQIFSFALQALTFTGIFAAGAFLLRWDTLYRHLWRPQFDA